MKKYLFTLIAGLLISVDSLAQIISKDNVGTTITLVTSGTGNSKEDATKNALRSALEQTYGTFVSSNSQVVNDELVKDEIVSISTGNIVSYEELSFIDSELKQVTVKAVVSITKLQSYAQNKGMSAELAGNTFAMNLKLEELNKKNQNLALEHLSDQAQILSQSFFDYKIRVGDPSKTSDDEVRVPVTLYIIANSNTVLYYDSFHKTLTNLAVKKTDYFDPYDESLRGIPYFRTKVITYYLRGDKNDQTPIKIIDRICSEIGTSVLNCEIVDNLDNVSGFEKIFGVELPLPYYKYKLKNDYATTNKLSYANNHPLHEGNFLSDGNVIKDKLISKVKEPKVNEVLFVLDLYLSYTVDEISKINKIEVRPKSQP